MSMAKSVARKTYFTFVGGLNTEAGPLTPTPNTWQDGDNVVPGIDGSLSKRLAVNLETDYALSSTSNTATEEQTAAFVVDEWNNVAGNGGTNFIVVQRGSTVRFYDNTASAISSTEKSFSIDLSTYKVANPNVAGYSPISCASANGKLIITSADTSPILVEYDADTDTIEHTNITVLVRDFIGADSGLDINERPTTLGAGHHYNLLNQGWDDTKIDAYKTASGFYPSNAQSWTAAKDSNDDFDPSLLDKQDFGTSPAPKGRYLLDVYYRSRQGASGIPIPLESESYRPTTCSFYAGRAWYAGNRSRTIGSWVLFSQVADTSDKYGKCYQDADPTSEFISDLVDSDGGVIPIQDAGTIIKILPAYNSLLVFADNGLWQIVGGLETGFSATSYEVRKLTSVGCLAAASVVEAEQSVYFWSGDGIWVVKPTQTGGFSIASVTNTTIQTFFRDIPVAGRTYVQGTYYLEGKTIYWVYNNDADQDGIVERFKKNALLSLDLRLGAFYTATISELDSGSPYIVGAVITKNKTTTDETFNVVVGSDSVVVSTDTVVASLTPDVPRNSEVKFLTVVPSSTVFKVSFAGFETGLVQASRFRDWYAIDSTGASYDTYIVTGYDLGNDQGADRQMQGTYLTAFFRRTETGIDSDGEPINASSCLLQARWNWTDSSIANKWSREQQIYRHKRLFFASVPSTSFEDGYPVVVTKNKIRGRGHSVAFKFSGEADKDMQLLGWAVIYIGNTNV